MFAEWSNRHFRRTKNQNFCCPTMVGRLSNIFLKSDSVDFTLWWWYLYRFLEKREKSNSYLNFSFHHYQRFSRISKRKWEIVKSAAYHKRFVQLDKLFRPMVTNTLNSHQFWKFKPTCIIKVGCPFWICLMVCLNSKIGSVNHIWNL